MSPNTRGSGVSKNIRKEGSEKLPVESHCWAIGDARLMAD